MTVEMQFAEAILDLRTRVEALERAARERDRREQQAVTMFRRLATEEDARPVLAAAAHDDDAEAIKLSEMLLRGPCANLRLVATGRADHGVDGGARAVLPALRGGSADV
jgi:hypothetical protein